MCRSLHFNQALNFVNAVIVTSEFWKRFCWFSSFRRNVCTPSSTVNRCGGYSEVQKNAVAYLSVKWICSTPVTHFVNFPERTWRVACNSLITQVDETREPDRILRVWTTHGQQQAPVLAGDRLLRAGKSGTIPSLSQTGLVPVLRHGFVHSKRYVAVCLIVVASGVDAGDRLVRSETAFPAFLLLLGQCSFKSFQGGC